MRKFDAVREYHDCHDAKSRKTCVSGENTAVRLPSGKLPGLFASESGSEEFVGKNKMTTSVETRITKFAR